MAIITTFKGGTATTTRTGSNVGETTTTKVVKQDTPTSASKSSSDTSPSKSPSSSKPAAERNAENHAIMDAYEEATGQKVQTSSDRQAAYDWYNQQKAEAKPSSSKTPLTQEQLAKEQARIQKEIAETGSYTPLTRGAEGEYYAPAGTPVQKLPEGAKEVKIGSATKIQYNDAFYSPETFYEMQAKGQQLGIYKSEKYDILNWDYVLSGLQDPKQQLIEITDQKTYLVFTDTQGSGFLPVEAYVGQPYAPTPQELSKIYGQGYSLTGQVETYKDIQILPPEGSGKYAFAEENLMKYLPPGYSLEKIGTGKFRFSFGTKEPEPPKQAEKWTPEVGHFQEGGVYADIEAFATDPTDPFNATRTYNPPEQFDIGKVFVFQEGQAAPYTSFAKPKMIMKDFITGEETKYYDLPGSYSYDLTGSAFHNKQIKELSAKEDLQKGIKTVYGEQFESMEQAEYRNTEAKINQKIAEVFSFKEPLIRGAEEFAEAVYEPFSKYQTLKDTGIPIPEQYKVLGYIPVKDTAHFGKTFALKLNEAAYSIPEGLLSTAITKGGLGAKYLLGTEAQRETLFKEYQKDIGILGGAGLFAASGFYITAKENPVKAVQDTVYYGATEILPQFIMFDLYGATATRLVGGLKTPTLKPTKATPTPKGVPTREQLAQALKEKLAREGALKSEKLYSVPKKLEPTFLRQTKGTLDDVLEAQFRYPKTPKPIPGTTQMKGDWGSLKAQSTLDKWIAKPPAALTTREQLALALKNKLAAEGVLKNPTLLKVPTKVPVQQTLVSFTPKTNLLTKEMLTKKLATEGVLKNPTLLKTPIKTPAQPILFEQPKSWLLPQKPIPKAPLQYGDWGSLKTQTTIGKWTGLSSREQLAQALKNKLAAEGVLKNPTLYSVPTKTPYQQVLFEVPKSFKVIEQPIKATTGGVQTKLFGEYMGSLKAQTTIKSWITETGMPSREILGQLLKKKMSEAGVYRSSKLLLVPERIGATLVETPAKFIKSTKPKQVFTYKWTEPIVPKGTGTVEVRKGMVQATKTTTIQAPKDMAGWVEPGTKSPLYMEPGTKSPTSFASDLARELEKVAKPKESKPYSGQYAPGVFASYGAGKEGFWGYTPKKTDIKEFYTEVGIVAAPFPKQKGGLSSVMFKDFKSYEETKAPETAFNLSDIKRYREITGGRDRIGEKAEIKTGTSLTPKPISKPKAKEKTRATTELMLSHIPKAKQTERTDISVKPMQGLGVEPGIGQRVGQPQLPEQAQMFKQFQITKVRQMQDTILKTKTGTPGGGGSGKGGGEVPPPPKLNLNGNQEPKQVKIPQQFLTPRREKEKKGARSVYADLFYLSKAQFKYGKGTSPSLKKRPEVWKYEKGGLGRIPTVEQLTKQPPKRKTFINLRNSFTSRRGIL